MPAFPVHDDTIYGGQDVRQWYAGLAMQGILAGLPRAAHDVASCADLAVKHADALIAELKRTEGDEV
jgi:hypothetical protein